jgi:hypothetical protein
MDQQDRTNPPDPNHDNKLLRDDPRRTVKQWLELDRRDRLAMRRWEKVLEIARN